MLSNRALAKICIFGTFGLTGAALLAQDNTQARIRNSTIYIEAFQYLNDNEKAVKYFGTPLKAGFINNFKEVEDQPDTVLWYKVPLKGPNGKGFLYYKAIKEHKWLLSKVELEVEKIPDKKYLIMEKAVVDEELE